MTYRGRLLRVALLGTGCNVGVSERVCGNRDLSYGKRDLSYGIRDLSYGKRDLSYGKRDLSYPAMWARVRSDSVGVRACVCALVYVRFCACVSVLLPTSSLPHSVIKTTDMYNSRQEEHLEIKMVGKLRPFAMSARLILTVIIVSSTLSGRYLISLSLRVSTPLTKACASVKRDLSKGKRDLLRPTDKFIFARFHALDQGLR